jgi:hypothetical protein
MKMTQSKTFSKSAQIMTVGTHPNMSIINPTGPLVAHSLNVPSENIQNRVDNKSHVPIHEMMPANISFVDFIYLVLMNRMF